MNAETLEIQHDLEKSRFILDLEVGLAKVEYTLKNGKMYLVHSEVPVHLRGQGIGKILVEKTFEKLTSEGYSAIAICPYIKAVAKRSDKWRDVIAT